MRALEARMEGFEVMPALVAAERGDIFVTVTGTATCSRARTSSVMKDGAVLANAGHFDVEIDLAALAGESRTEPPEECSRSSPSTTLGDRRLNLLASGRVVNLAAGQGHPAAVMDMSFANQVLAVEHLVSSSARAGRPPGAGGASIARSRGSSSRRSASRSTR